MLDRLENGLTELNGLTPIRSPVKSVTDLGAGKPQFDITHLVNHRVLQTLADHQPAYTGTKPTLIATRRMLAETNAFLAGFVFVVSPAEFRLLIAAFNEGRVSSPPLDSLD
jgi:hypothetical protein